MSQEQIKEIGVIEGRDAPWTVLTGTEYQKYTQELRRSLYESGP